jgi:hypothetical protein
VIGLSAATAGLSRGVGTFFGTEGAERRTANDDPEPVTGNEAAPDRHEREN